MEEIAKQWTLNDGILAMRDTNQYLCIIADELSAVIRNLMGEECLPKQDPDEKKCSADPSSAFEALRQVVIDGRNVADRINNLVAILKNTAC